MKNAGKHEGAWWIWLAAAGAAVYVLYQQGYLSTAPAAPLSIYPEYGYTATTSMAATPAQQASTVIPSTSLFTTTQGQATSALLTQCAGSWPSCTPMMGDTSLYTS